MRLEEKVALGVISQESLADAFFYFRERLDLMKTYLRWQQSSLEWLGVQGKLSKISFSQYLDQAER